MPAPGRRDGPPTHASGSEKQAAKRRPHSAKASRKAEATPYKPRGRTLAGGEEQENEDEGFQAWKIWVSVKEKQEHPDELANIPTKMSRYATDIFSRFSTADEEIPIDEEPSPREKRRPGAPPIELPVNPELGMREAPTKMAWERPPHKVMTKRQTETLQEMLF